MPAALARGGFGNMDAPYENESIDLFANRPLACPALKHEVSNEAVLAF
jgi:hypothetical protein